MNVLNLRVAVALHVVLPLYHLSLLHILSLKLLVCFYLLNGGFPPLCTYSIYMYKYMY